MVRASALGTKLQFDPHFRVGPASLPDAQHYRVSLENKLASLLVPLGKALGGIPHFGVVDR